jgi:hypothetical protein
MSLAKPATNSNGQTILAAGIDLDEALIARIQRMGVSAIYVKEGSAEGGGPEKTLADLEQELDRRFRKAVGDPACEMIREAVRQHLHATHDVKPFAGGGPRS